MFDEFGPEYPIERVSNAMWQLESAYWELVNENERLKAEVETLNKMLDES